MKIIATNCHADRFVGWVLSKAARRCETSPTFWLPPARNLSSIWSHPGWGIGGIGEENRAVLDREHPFRPSISNTMRPARIIDERFVEVHIPGQGWYRAPSRRFARNAYFSAHDTYAISVADALDRTAPDYDSVRQSLLFYLHDLQVGGNHWGTPLQVRSSAVLEHSFHGISIADFSQTENERTFWIGIGRARSPVVMSGFAIKCRANTDQ